MVPRSVWIDEGKVFVVVASYVHGNRGRRRTTRKSETVLQKQNMLPRGMRSESDFVHVEKLADYYPGNGGAGRTISMVWIITQPRDGCHGMYSANIPTSNDFLRTKPLSPVR